MTALDPATADLLEVVQKGLTGMADWRAVAVVSTLGRVLDGTDDPGAAADWLREFLAQREGAEAVRRSGQGLAEIVEAGR